MTNNWKNKQNTLIAVVCVTLVSAFCVAADKEKESSPKEVTMTGKVMDMHSLMTGKFESGDKAKCCRDSIKMGVPAVLQTEQGLVIIGEGAKGAARTIAPLALKDVEVKGTLYEKNGLRYIDIKSAKVVKPADVEKGSPDDTEGNKSPGLGENPNVSACCLPQGNCVEMEKGSCANMGGIFHAGYTCEEVECEQIEE